MSHPHDPGPVPASGSQPQPPPDLSGVPTWLKGIGALAAVVLSSGAGSVFGASQATVDAAKERAVLAEKVERVQEDVDDLDSKVDRLFDLLTRRGEP